MPIVVLKDNLYFIGLYKMNVKMHADYLMVQIGQNKWERFSEYLRANRENFTKFLTLLSLKNDDEPIVIIVNKLMKQMPLQGLNSSFMSQAGQSLMRGRDSSLDNSNIFNRDLQSLHHSAIRPSMSRGATSPLSQIKTDSG